MMREERLPQAVRKAGYIAAIGLVLGLPLPFFMGVGDASYLLSLVLITIVAGLCALAHDREERPVFLGLFAGALLLRFYAQLALYKWSIAGGGPFLNPDATLYLHRSLFLAADNFQHALTPALYFGTYDCAHYYLFAALIKFGGADMYGLQMFNAGLTALVGPLAYGSARAVLPRYALPLGVVVSVSPTLIAYGINDLLKDPGVIASAMMALWAIARLSCTDRPAAQAGLILVGAAALAYSRMSRFYVVPFFAAAFMGAWIVTRLSTNGGMRRLIPNTRLSISVITIFLIAEIVPWRLGWPPSTVMVANQVASTLDTPAMRVYAKGLFDRSGSDTADRPVQYVPPSYAVNDIFRDFSRGARLPSALEAEQAAERERQLENPVKLGTERVSLSRRVVTMAVNGFRKFFGPFPWVMPQSWDPKTILHSDALLFPGMLVWYAVLPLALGGGLFLVWQVIQRRGVGFPLVIVAAIVGVFLAQYLVLNLSWRQREFMFPFMLVLACFAIEQGWTKPLVRYGYAAYWAMLVLVAVVHLSVRAFLA